MEQVYNPDQHQVLEQVYNRDPVLVAVAQASKNVRLAWLQGQKAWLMEELAWFPEAWLQDHLVWFPLNLPVSVHQVLYLDALDVNQVFQPAVLLDAQDGLQMPIQ